MKNFNKTIRLFGLGLLIVLATLGVGIGGGVPVSSNSKKENSNEIKTEIVELKDNKTKLNEIKEMKN